MLPKGAYVFEVASTTDDSILMSSVCGLEHRFTTVAALLKDVLEEEEEFVAKNPTAVAVPVIYMPRRDLEGFFSHAGDGLREMARLWEKKGYVRVKEHPDCTMMWWDSVGEKGVLLYDRDSTEWLTQAPFVEQSSATSLGVVAPSTKWTHWALKPELVEEMTGLEQKGFQERSSGVVYYGKAVSVGGAAGAESWSTVCNEWHASDEHILTPYQFLEKLASSRYSLCFATRSHRIMESFAMGCVPIVTADVDMSVYADEPKEGLHYIRVNVPEDVTTAVTTMTPEKWAIMSKAGSLWWKRNASCDGSFTVTKAILQA
jgi:hypothetical protein